MITRIARKELLVLRRDDRLRTLSLAMLLLLGFALALGFLHFREAQSERALAQHAERAVWENQGRKNPHSAAHFGVYAFKPQLPLVAFDRGVEPYTGVAVWLEAHKQNDFRFKPAQDASSLVRFGQLTVASVLQILLPLLIVLTAFGAFAAERESGTMRQLLSMGVSSRQIAFGKTLGVLWALAFVLVPAALLGAGALAALSAGPLLPVSAGRTLTLSLSYLFYFGALTGIALAVSALAPSSRTALVALLGLWIFNCLMAPKAAADIARAAVPTPSAFEFAAAVEHDLKNGMDGHSPQEARMKHMQARLLKQYNVQDPKLLPVNLTGVILDEGEKYGDLVFDRHYGRLWSAFDRQNRIHEAAGIIAPVLAIRSVSMAVSGTDYRQHRHFAEAAESYRRAFLATLNQDIIRNANSAGAGPYLRGDDLWKKIEPFRYEAPGLGWVLANEWFSLATLALWCVGALAFAVRSATRMPVD